MKKRIISYIKKITEVIISWWLKIIIWKEKRSYKWYTGINTLPVARFFDVLNSGDLRYLLKLKDYDNLHKIHFKLDELWNSIYEEYLIISDNKDYKLNFNQRKQILELNTDYEKLRFSVFTYVYNQSEKAKKILIANGIPTDLKDDLLIQKAKSKLKSIEHKIKFKTKEYKEANKKSNTNINKYNTIIDDIEKYKGHQIDLEKTTVKTFITYINGLKKHIENAKRENRKKRYNKR